MEKVGRGGIESLETNMGILCGSVPDEFIAQKDTQKAGGWLRGLRIGMGVESRQAVAALSLHCVVAAFELRAYD